MIIVIDFGSQYTHLITKLLTYTLKVPSKLIPYTKVNEIGDSDCVKGIILSGGPQSVPNLDPKYNLELHKLIGKCANQIPVLGVCFGLQWLAHYYGGKTEKAASGEYGETTLTVGVSNELLRGESIVWMSHEDNVTELPDSFVVLGKTDNCPYAFVYNATDKVYGVQFHPEVEHTVLGKQIYKRFVVNVCGCTIGSTTTNTILDITQAELRKQYVDVDGGNTVTSNGNVLLALSGGVDSTVLSYLLAKTLPGNVFCVFVNNGLMRKGESKEICKRFEFLGDRFICYNAKNIFRNALVGVSEPEAKRKIIGRVFIESFEDAIADMPVEYEWLAQGTIYPDIIESSGLNGTAKVIKSHHNVGGLPERMKLKLLEPLKYLFKDQVRELGRELGLDYETINRHPFPGPGLGIRIVGEVTTEFIRIVKIADKIFIDSLKECGAYYKVSQAYAGLFPVKTVGVVGDNRRYEWVIVLRAVTTTDFMTASACNENNGIDLVFLGKVATKIVNSCSSVSRVVYDVTSKPPGTIEME